MRNGVLLGIVIALLSFIYFYEELGAQREAEEQKNRTTLFDLKKLGKITGMELPRIKIEKRKEAYYDERSGVKLSQKKIDLFFENLSSFKIKKIIDKNPRIHSHRQEFFPDEKRKMIFYFEKGKISFLLGNKIYFDQSFYMEVTNQARSYQIIAYDSAPMRGIYQASQAHRHDLKYKRFRALFDLSIGFFKEGTFHHD